MNFLSATPSVVRAIRQRDLLYTWLRLHAREQGLPLVTEYEPSRLKEELNELIYYHVEATQAAPVFVIQSEGTRLSTAYGQIGKGRQLEEYLGPMLAPFVLPAYLLCVARQLPVYTIDEVKDAGGHQVEYERLLLPFGASGVVTEIVASLKTISVDGGFQMRNLMRSMNEMPRPAVRAVIDRELVVHRLNRTAPAEDLEF